MSSPKKRMKKTKNAKTNKDENCVLVDNIPFEELMNAPATQAAALKEYKKTLENAITAQQARERDEKKQTSARELREFRDKPSAVVGGSGSGDPGMNGNGKHKTSEEGEEEVDDLGGLAAIQALLKRYDEGREKDETRKKLTLGDKVLSDDELDEDIIEDDFRAGLTGKNNFLLYSVPQYELKEKLYQMHCAVIGDLSNAEMIALFNQVVPDLNQIRKGELHSKRHEIFKDIGLSKQPLRDLTVCEPFTSHRDNQVMNLIADRLFGGLGGLVENNGEYLHYITNVLVPEALIRIFAKANGIPIELAEKEMRFKAAYDGELPTDVISSIPPDDADD